MRTWFTILSAAALSAAAVLGGGCATAASERVNKAAAEKLDSFERTGEVVSCIRLARGNSITPVTESTFLIRVGVNNYYVNEVSGRCRGATRSSTRLQYTTSLSQLCRNEIIRVVDNSAGFQTGACGLGSFEKLAKKAPPNDEGQ